MRGEKTEKDDVKHIVVQQLEFAVPDAAGAAAVASAVGAQAAHAAAAAARKQTSYELDLNNPRDLPELFKAIYNLRQKLLSMAV